MKFESKTIHQGTVVFVVGSSRSGTTMMGRILGKSPHIHTFEELHFFDELLVEKVVVDTNVDLIAALMSRERVGYHKAKNSDAFKVEATELLAGITEPKNDQEGAFSSFLRSEVTLNNSSIPCKQTPRYVFHIDQILSTFPDARIVCMIRDPRDVAISQKYRWRVRGDKSRWTPRASLQSWANYHSWVTSKLWKASMTAALSVRKNPQVFMLKYEDLLDEPETHVKQVAEFIGIEYNEEMLSIESVISSFGHAKVKGIDNSRKGNWSSKGLKNSEIAIIESVCSAEMSQLGYESNTVEGTAFLRIWGFSTLPFKLLCATIMNVGRFKSGFKPLIKRLRS